MLNAPEGLNKVILRNIKRFDCNFRCSFRRSFETRVSFLWRKIGAHFSEQTAQKSVFELNCPLINFLGAFAHFCF